MSFELKCCEMLRGLLTIENDFKREKYGIELSLALELIKWRNGAENYVIELSNPLVNGMYFLRNVSSYELQVRYANIYNDLYKLNNNSVSDDVVTKYDDKIREIIAGEDGKPLWYDLSQDDVRDSYIPEFRFQDLYEYKKAVTDLFQPKSNSTNLNAGEHNDMVNEEKEKEKKEEEKEEGKGKGKKKGQMMNNKKNRKSGSASSAKSERRNIWISHPDKDTKLLLPDVLDVTGVFETTVLNYLEKRMREELDPRYIYHPIPAMFITLLFLKVLTGNSYYSYGIRYMELVSNHVGSGSLLTATFPVQFKSDGSVTTFNLYSHYIMKIRFILNNLTYLLTYRSTHQFKTEYLEVSDESLLYMLRNPNSGKVLKSALTNINLYYGMKVGEKNSQNADDDADVDYSHDHPIHDTISRHTEILVERYSYSASRRCSGHDDTKLSHAVYSRTVKKFIKSDLEALLNLNLRLLHNFVAKRLVKKRVNSGMVKDVVFMRTLINMGGYSRSHQIKDFSTTIDAINVMNDSFLTSVNFEKCKEWLLPKMKSCGKNMTMNVLQSTRRRSFYPTGDDFKTGIDRYLTSRSAGIGNMKLKIPLEGKIYNVRSTAKSAFAAALGNEIFDIRSISNVPQRFKDYLLVSPDNEKEKLLFDIKNQKVSRQELMRILGQNSIGSRSTTAFRAVRPIYINPIGAHLAQAAVIGPHIDLTTHFQTDPPKSLWFDGNELGIGFATLYQDGTSDMIAPMVESTSHGLNLLALADCSSWDQTYLMAFIQEYYDGIKSALDEYLHADDTNFYLINTAYQEHIGMTLSDILNFLSEFQKERIYVASYLGETKDFIVKYMSSGRLDTFYLNTVQNTLITEEIGVRTLKMVGGSPRIIWHQEAGDDAAIIFDGSTITNSTQIEKIREVIVQTYTESNHIINPQKTVMSNTSGEYAKIYCYCGMHFRDPSIQLHESEKTSNASNETEVVRGFAQVAHEYNRRAIGSLFCNSLYCRLLLSIAYCFTLKGKNAYDVLKSLNVQNVQIDQLIRYYPPLQSIIAPSAYGGGVGMSYTGLSLNEVAFIQTHLDGIMSRGLYYIDLIKYKFNTLVTDSLLYAYLHKKSDKSLLNELVTSNEVKKLDVSKIQYSSSDAAFSGANFARGLDFKLNTLSSNKQRVSDEAISILERMHIKVPVSLQYRNMPYISFSNAIKSLSVDKRLVTDSTGLIILKSSDDALSHGNITAPLVSVNSKYDIYAMLNFKLLTSKEMILDPESVAPRYISSPDESKLLEKFIGTRVGRQLTTSTYAGDFQLLKFIRRNGLPITEDSLISAILNSGVVGSANPHISIKAFLMAISGDEASSAELSQFLLNEKPHWEDKNLAVTVRGTILENLDSSYLNIKRFVHVYCDRIPKELLKLIHYIGYIYLVQSLIVSNDKYICVDVEIKGDQMYDLLKSLTPIANRRKKGVKNVKINDIDNKLETITEDAPSDDYTNVNLNYSPVLYPIIIPFLRNSSFIVQADPDDCSSL